MNYKFKLSVVVAVYNVADYLDRCIDSIVNQDICYDDYEILIINDGSTDNSLEIAKKYESSYPNIRVISKENGGLSSVRNLGNEQAKGNYIMHVDGDDFLEKDVIGKILDVAISNTLDLCFFGTRRYPDRHVYIQNKKFDRNKLYSGNYLLLHGMNVSSTWCSLYSNSFLRKVNLKYFDRISHQDVEFNLRLYPFAHRVMFVDNIVYNYCVLGESITRTNNIEKRKKNLLDDIIIAKNIIDFANSGICEEEISTFLIRRTNSSTLANLISFCHRKSLYGYVFAKQYITEASNRRIYPIKGRAMSLKMTLLIPIINIRILYLLFLKIWNNK